MENPIDEDTIIRQIHTEKIKRMRQDISPQPQRESPPPTQTPAPQEGSASSTQTPAPQQQTTNGSERSNVTGLPREVWEPMLESTVSRLERQFELERQELRQKMQESSNLYEEQIEALRQESAQKLEQARSETEQAYIAMKAFGMVSENMRLDPGVPIASERPTPALHIYGSTEGRQAYREITRLLNEAPTVSSIGLSGEVLFAKDTQAARRFMRQHREAVFNGLQAEMQRAGFLMGTVPIQKEMPTGPGSIVYAFMEVLSMEIERLSQSPRFVFENLVTTTLKIGTNAGIILKIKRNEWLREGETEADYELDPDVEITSAGDPIEGGSVPVEIKEYGRGKGGAVRPVIIPEFYESTSLEPLADKLNTTFGHSYRNFKDIAIRQRMYATNHVVYNDKSRVTTTPADVNAGDKGTMSYDFLVNLHAYMSSKQIRAWEDNGCYAIVMHPIALAQLKIDLKQQGYYLDQLGLERITNMFNRLTLGSSEIIPGFEGMIANFMIFCTNALSTGVPGNEGVNSDALGVGPTLVRSSMAAGFGTIVRVIAKSFEISLDPSTNYNRMIKAIWRSCEGFGSVDVDPTSNPPHSNNQQLGCVEIRTTDMEV